jgi:hypothetical protein
LQLSCFIFVDGFDDEAAILGKKEVMFALAPLHVMTHE